MKVKPAPALSLSTSSRLLSIMSSLQRLVLDPSVNEPPTRDHDHHATSLPTAKVTQVHPTKSGAENASILFVGNATTILEWEGIRLMTDPNFLHAGDHVHLGPGLSGVRQTNPALDLHELPRIDVVLLSHYHGYAAFIFVAVDLVLQHRTTAVA
jgi:hypothetical protein